MPHDPLSLGHAHNVPPRSNKKLRQSSEVTVLPLALLPYRRSTFGDIPFFIMFAAEGRSSL